MYILHLLLQNACPSSTNYRGSQQLHLAVLHPKEVAVYSLSSQSSEDPSGPDQSLSDPSAAFQYLLLPAYQNSMSRTACNMTIGPFGRAQGENSF